MENERPNYYAIIPAEVRYDNELKDKAKLLYGEITSLSQKNGYCYATNKYFANLYKISTTTVSLLIKDLIEKGYLESEIIYKGGTKEILNRYLRIVKDPYLRNLKYPIYENLKDNNINTNNTSMNNKYKEYIVEIVDYLNFKADTKYKHTTRSTKEKIIARLNENYTIEDFKKVIDKKVKEWKDTEMEKYLRPETLFGTKFESYVNQKEYKTKQQQFDEVMEKFMKEEE